MFESAASQRAVTVSPVACGNRTQPPSAETAEEALVDEIVALERAKATIEARVMTLTADLADLATGWVDPRDDRADDPLSGAVLAAAELAPALHLAPVTAGIRVERARRIRDWLPATLGVMAEGNLDLGRVLAIDEATQFLSADAAARVERMVLPRAVDQTAGELRAALRKAVIAVDPDGAEQRRKVAIKGRGVTRYQRDDGMCAIEAVLSAIDTGEIYDLIDEVARRTKTTDDTRSMDARRADALVWLMLGRDPQLGPEDPAPPAGPAAPPDGPAAPPAGPAGPAAPPAGPAAPSPRGALSSAARVAAGQEASTSVDAWDDAMTGNQQADRPSSHPRHSDQIDDDADGWSQWPDARETAKRDAELTRFDQAQDARTTRISELATLALSAMTSRRPESLRWVALNPVVRSSSLTTIVGELEGYGPITRQFAEHLLSSGAARAPDPPSGRMPTAAQAELHDPPAWLDRETRARDGTCRYPGCRRTARRGDLDHTVRFPRGKTVPDNLGALCRRHHRVKHSGAWRVSQGQSAVYSWTSTITGRSYLTYPRGTSGVWLGATTGWPDEGVADRRDDPVARRARAGAGGRS